MRELVSELTPRAGPALSLSRETPRAVLCVVCGRRACLCLSLTLSRSPARSRWEGGGGWCDDCVAVGFRGRWWRVGGATLCLGRGLLVVGGERPGLVSDLVRRGLRAWQVCAPLVLAAVVFPSPSHHHPITSESRSPLPPGSTFPPPPSYSELSPSYTQATPQAPELPCPALSPKVTATCRTLLLLSSTRSNITSETAPTRRPPTVPCPIPAANGRRAPLDPISPSAIAPAGDETALGAASGFPRQVVGRHCTLCIHCGTSDCTGQYNGYKAVCTTRPAQDRTGGFLQLIAVNCTKYRM